MFMKKELRKWTAMEKEKILHDIQRLGPNAGCRKYNIAKSLYYTWLDKYNAHGVSGLENQRGKSTDKKVRLLEKEIRLLKEIIIEKELESKLKDELLKKNNPQWKK